MRTGTQVWTYDTTLQPDKRKWIGYEVHAADGDIGKIDEMSTEAGRGSIVVDTGPWIFGKKRLLPAACVRTVDHNDKTVTVSLTKDQIKNAPDFEKMKDEERYYEEHGRYYGTFL